MRIDWEDIWSNLASFYFIALAIYPTMSGETIMASVYDGSIWLKMINVVFAIIAARHKGEA